MAERLWPMAERLCGTWLRGHNELKARATGAVGSRGGCETTPPRAQPAREPEKAEGNRSTWTTETFRN